MDGVAVVIQTLPQFEIAVAQLQQQFFQLPPVQQIALIEIGQIAQQAAMDFAAFTPPDAAQLIFDANLAPQAALTALAFEGRLIALDSIFVNVIAPALTTLGPRGR